MNDNSELRFTKESYLRRHFSGLKDVRFNRYLQRRSITNELQWNRVILECVVLAERCFEFFAENYSFQVRGGYGGRILVFSLDDVAIIVGNV